MDENESFVRAPIAWMESKMVSVLEWLAIVVFWVGVLAFFLVLYEQVLTEMETWWKILIYVPPFWIVSLSIVYSKMILVSISGTQQVTEEGLLQLLMIRKNTSN
mgnify:CR=1 FL=1